jgi:hypothetical protein
MNRSTQPFSQPFSQPFYTTVLTPSFTPRSTGTHYTAAYITFCVAVGLLCIGLVCSIALPGGNLWYSLALVSPLSGSYYMVGSCVHKLNECS